MHSEFDKFKKRLENPLPAPSRKKKKIAPTSLHTSKLSSIRRLGIVSPEPVIFKSRLQVKNLS